MPVGEGDERYRQVLRSLFAGICVVAYAAPFFWFHGIWWRTLSSTTLILAIGLFLFGRRAVRLFGLNLSPRQLATSLALLLVLLPLTNEAIFTWLAVEPLSAIRNSSPRSWIHQFFQVFNDEIILRAALLTVLLRAFPHPKTVALGTALLFAIGHHLVYRLGGVEIDLPAMVTLFSFGAVLNVLFIWCGHIGYGFAIHYAWNFWRFAGTRYYLDGVRLGEGSTFNHIEGSAMVVGVSVAAFVVTFTLFCKLATTREGAHRSNTDAYVP